MHAWALPLFSLGTRLPMASALPAPSLGVCLGELAILLVGEARIWGK